MNPAYLVEVDILFVCGNVWW